MVALAWGLALNGAHRRRPAARRAGALGTAARRARAAAPPSRARLRKLALRRRRSRSRSRACTSSRCAARPGLGEGNQTSLTYAYLFGSMLVAATASSLALVSSAPLTRRAVDADGASAHVLHASWLCLALIGAAAGVFALVGGRGRRLRPRRARTRARSAPTSGTSSSTCRRGSSLRSRSRSRSRCSSCSRRLGGSCRSRSSPSPSTSPCRSRCARRSASRPRARARHHGVPRRRRADGVRLDAHARADDEGPRPTIALLVGALTFASFGVGELVADGFAAAAVGLALYVASLALLRPRGLVEAWRYVRVLHQ